MGWGGERGAGKKRVRDENISRKGGNVKRSPPFRAGEGGAAAPRALSDDYEFLAGIRRKRAQRLVAPVFQNECNGFTKISQALFSRSPLAIGAGYFGAVSDVPWAISFDDRGELVPHVSFYRRQRARTLSTGSPAGLFDKSLPELHPGSVRSILPI